MKVTTDPLVNWTQLASSSSDCKKLGVIPLAAHLPVLQDIEVSVLPQSCSPEYGDRHFRVNALLFQVSLVLPLYSLHRVLYPSLAPSLPFMSLQSPNLRFLPTPTHLSSVQLPPSPCPNNTLPLLPATSCNCMRNNGIETARQLFGVPQNVIYIYII